MGKLTEEVAKKIARKYLDDKQIRHPSEEYTKADELCKFWFWNPPSFTAGQPDHWNEWKVFRLIDPDAGDEGIYKMSVDMARYFVERSETDCDYWDALKQIVAKLLDRSSGIEDTYLNGWLIDMLNGERKAPRSKPGNRARKYHSRNGLIYFAMETLSVDSQMSQENAAKWIGELINKSPESIRTIYRNAQTPLHVDNHVEDNRGVDQSA